MISRLFLCLSFLIAGVAAARPASLFMDPRYTLTINTEINSSLDEISYKLLFIPAIPGDKIYVILDSPGGSVAASNLFIQALESLKLKGVTSVCLASQLTASAAFNIWTHCSERYALPRTELLFHPVRIMGISRPLTGRELSKYGRELSEFDDKLITYLCDTMIRPGADACQKIVVENYFAETMWTAEDLLKVVRPGYFRIVEAINMPEDLAEHGIPMPDTKNTEGGGSDD